MERAAVFIGVDGTDEMDGLRKLKAAASGARALAAWAATKGQGIGTIEVLTDEDGKKVTPQDILETIEKIGKLGSVQQLIVYFAGHGIQDRFDVLWLLSGAHKNSNAAVSVCGSSFLARASGFKHVVMISDCCRLTKGSGMEWIRGSEIFPNQTNASPEETSVDNFYATSVGDSAFEAEDPSDPQNKYVSIYTKAFLDALENEELADADGRIYPKAIRDFLPSHIYKNVIPSLKLAPTMFQKPRADILSDPPDSWLARHEPRQTLPDSLYSRRVSLDRAPGPTGFYSAGSPRANRKEEPDGLESIVRNLIRLSFSGDKNEMAKVLAAAGDLGYTDVARTVSLAAKSFGPTHHETGCGIKIRGAGIVNAWSVSATWEFASNARDDLRITPDSNLGASVLIELDQGAGVLIPILPEFLTALTLENGELIDVSYEPVDHSPRWEHFKREEDKIRALQATAVVSTQNRIFKLDKDDAAARTASLMQSVKGAAPMLGVYAAYAYDVYQRHARLAEMCEFMARDLGGLFYDVAMLAGRLGHENPDPPPRVFSAFPMLSQGWVSMRSRRLPLPGSLKGIEDVLVPSVWTMFNRTGISICRQALDKGDLQ